MCACLYCTASVTLQGIAHIPFDDTRLPRKLCVNVFVLVVAVCARIFFTLKHVCVLDVYFEFAFF